MRVLPLFLLGCALGAGGLPAAAAPSPEAGLPLFDYFGVRDYQEHNQTWGATQDRHGTLYVGNKDCVLAYDGQAWRSIPVPGLFVRGLGVEADDRVWLGSVNEFGTLEDDGAGGRRYVSAIAQVPAAQRDVGEISEIFPLPHGIYLATLNRLLRWHDGQLVEIAAGSLLLCWQIGDELVVKVRGETTVRAFNGSTWRTIVDAPSLRDQIVEVFAPRADGSALIVTVDDGIWQWRAGALERWRTEVDALLLARRPRWCLALRDGGLAISFRPDGFVLLDADGRLRHAFLNQDSGLPNLDVRRFFQDRSGDLWVMLNNGLARFAWPPNTTHFGPLNGLGGSSMKCFARLGDRFYAGTSEGLFVLRPATLGPGTPVAAHFELVPGLASNIWGLAVAGDELLVAVADRFAVVRAGAVVPSHDAGPDAPSSVLALPPTGGLLGTEHGIRWLRREPDGWHVGENLPGVVGEVRELIEDADGSVWVGVTGKGFFRLLGVPGTRSADGQPVRVEPYPGGHGLASAAVSSIPQLARSGDRVLFLDDRKVYAFDAATKTFQRVLDANAKLGVPITMPTLGDAAANQLWTRTLRTDPGAGPWKGRQFWRVTLPDTWEALPFAAANLVGENPVILEEPAVDGGSVLWLGGSEGLVRAELPAGFVRPRLFQATIRGVQAGGGGAQPLAPAVAPVLPHSFRSLDFQFTTDRVDDHRMVFQTRLEGRDPEWSAFGPEPHFSAAGLSPGSYVLHARARDADGRVSAPATFAFRVRPAWWQAAWALGLYVLGAAGMVTAIVHWRGRALRRRNEELERIVATRTTELREAKAVAEAANQSKSAFLASMSHELRTPLNAILGFSQILRRAPGLEPEHRQRLEIIGRNGEHLLQMINEVLDLSKIEAGRLTLLPRPTEFSRLVHEIAESFAARAADKGLEFRRELAADLPAVAMVDEVKLRQVLINLLGNALKFTDAGSVTLRVTQGTGDRGQVTDATSRPLSPVPRPLLFSVADTGIGIAAADHERIFEPFQQGAGAFITQGTGLGLAISQRIVGLMGGTIRVESPSTSLRTGPAEAGPGSHFWFEVALPLAEGAPSRPLVNVVTGYHGQRRRLLVVDDEQTNRDVMRGLLEPLGFSIEECADGRACVTAFTRQPADAVLLDLRMPGELDGYATARALRALPGGGAPALIAVSASVFEEDRHTALEAGCDAFVPKPFTEERLFGALGDCLDLKWVLQENGADAGVLPPLPPATAEELRDLARHGDIKVLRERLHALESALPDCRATLAHLDALAAGFQLGRLRQELRTARSTNSRSPL